MVGHSSIPHNLSNFIWAFHMPLFFMASGWVTRWDKYALEEFVKHRAMTLLIPFIIYSFIVLLVEHLIGICDFSLWLKKGWQGYALWFVPVLFFSSIMAKIIYDIKGNPILVGAFVCLILGAVLKYTNVSLPWTLSTVPYATFLVLVSSFLRRYGEIIDMPRWYIGIVCLLITIVISHFWRLDLAWNNIIPVIPLTIGALAGCIMIATFSSFINKKSVVLTKVLTEIGKETYLIMAFSQIINMTIIQCTSIGRIERNLVNIIILICLKFLKDGLNKVVGKKIL